MENLKKIKNPREITLETLTPESKEYIDFLKKEYKSWLEKFPKLNTTWTLLRFLRARDFNIKATKKMLEDALGFFESTDWNWIK